MATGEIGTIEILGVKVPVYQDGAFWYVDTQKINRQNPDNQITLVMDGAKEKRIGLTINNATMEKISQKGNSTDTDNTPLGDDQEKNNPDRLIFFINLIESGYLGKERGAFKQEGDPANRDYYLSESKIPNYQKQASAMNLSYDKSFKGRKNLHQWIKAQKGETIEKGTEPEPDVAEVLTSPERADWDKMLNDPNNLLYKWDKDRLKGESVAEKSFRSRSHDNLWTIAVTQSNLGMSPESLAFKTKDERGLSKEKKRELSEQRAKKTYEAYVQDAHMIHPRKKIKDKRKIITEENRYDYGEPSAHTGRIVKVAGKDWNYRTIKNGEKNPTFNEKVPKPSGQSRVGKVAWYDYAKAYRSFLESQGDMVFGKTDVESFFHQSTKQQAGNFADVKASDVQLFILDKCVKTASQDFTTWDIYKKLKPEEKFGKFGLYLLYKICLNIGLRAEEVYTIPTSKPADTNPSSILADAGVEPLLDAKNRPTDVYEITVRTRKTAWVGKYIANGFVLDRETNALIKEKIELVRDGDRLYDQGKITEKEAYRDFGIMVRDAEGRRIKYHTLVGKDGEFTKPTGYGDGKWYLFPSKKTSSFKSIDENQPSSSAKPSVTILRVNKNRKLLAEQLKLCYFEVGTHKSIEFEGETVTHIGELDNEYFYKKPVHALRHLFAHIFLNLLDWNYGEVAKIGHWGTISELERSYGEYPKYLLIKNMVKAVKEKSQTWVQISDATSELIADGYYKTPEPETK